MVSIDSAESRMHCAALGPLCDYLQVPSAETGGTMAGRGTGPDFVEALARGLDILRCFEAERPRMSLTEIAAATDLARPTARRLLLTLEELGYVRVAKNSFTLTPRVLQLGMSYVSSLGLWQIARPHLEALVRQTGESSSMAQLDGSDIVYVARVAVPKIIALRVEIGTRFPALRTSQGKYSWPPCPRGTWPSPWLNPAALACPRSCRAIRRPFRMSCAPFEPEAGHWRTRNSHRASAPSLYRCATEQEPCGQQ